MILLLLLTASWIDAAVGASADYLLVDAATGDVVAERWVEPVEASPGSLLKPFVALAYAREHGLRFPAHRCDGSKCWLPTGHGRVDIEEALANSCNTYFRLLSAHVSPASVGFETTRLGLRAPPDNSPPEALWGLTSDWRAFPDELLGAYLELARRRSEPEESVVVQGLRAAAQIGTASALNALGQPALAKTGTAACAHPAGGEGDGYAVALYPAAAPRYALIVRIHDRTGRYAAAAVANILGTLESR